MKTSQSYSYYPLFLNISGRRCVVVGGGEVALRKVKAFLEHGANVEVVSPEICPQLAVLAESGRIRVFRRHYQPGDLRGALIVIAATNHSEINRDVVKEAKRQAVLVNVVDDTENSAFIVPSYVRRGNITIAVSTAGKSPALARKIRTRLENDFGDEYASLALLVEEVRTEVKRRGIYVDGDAWQEALDVDCLIDLLKKGDTEKAKAILVTELERRQRQLSRLGEPDGY